MRKFVFVLAAALALAGALSACDTNNNNNPGSSALHTSFVGLPDLGASQVYEGWLIINGQPQSTGRFTVSGGAASQTTFQLGTLAGDPSTFVLTLEPATGDDPAPAATKILAGPFSSGSATLSTANSAALGTDFATASGQFLLNTPSTAATDADFDLGIWWLDPAGGPGPSLSLPTLPAGWAYEGWAVVGGSPLTTGRFTSESGADSDGAGPTAGPDAAPPFPGQDFITPPVDLHGALAVITLEPDPDNSPEPFSVKLLSAEVPASLPIGTLSPMTNIASTTLPSGTVQIVAH